MSETHEAAGQHMQEEAADKFVRVERYSLDTIVLTTITIGKADAPITHVEEPMVGNGDAMGIAADIVLKTGAGLPGAPGRRRPSL